MVAGKAERDSVDQNGRTPLHLAAIKGMVKVVELLLGRDHGEDQNAHNAVIGITDSNHCTPLDLALKFGHEPTAQKLLTYTTKTKKSEK